MKSLLLRFHFSKVHLPTQLHESLLRQAHREYSIHILYTNLGYWYDHQSFTGIGSYFLKSAQEEQQHAYRILDFLNVRGHRVTLDHNKLDVPVLKIEKPEEGFFLNESVELQNFNLLNDLAAQARDTDQASHEFVSRLLKDQVAEYDRVTKVVAQARAYSHFPGLFYHLDHQLKVSGINFDRWQ